VFTDSPITMLQAESQHRGHAIIEQVHADLRAGALAHLPSGHLQANTAWLQCAVMVFNLMGRTGPGALAGALHTKATTRSHGSGRLLIKPSRRKTGSTSPVAQHGQIPGKATREGPSDSRVTHHAADDANPARPAPDQPTPRLTGGSVRGPDAPYTSSTWAAIAPVVRPFADKDNTISSTPLNRLWRFLTICGSKPGVRVTRYLDLHRHDFGQNRRRPSAVA
jgi:hypothetical protein